MVKGRQHRARRQDEARMAPARSKNPANKVGRERSTAELVEKRGLAKGNLRQQTSQRIQSRGRLQRALERIGQAVNEPRLRVTT